MDMLGGRTRSFLDLSGVWYGMYRTLLYYNPRAVQKVSPI